MPHYFCPSPDFTTSIVSQSVTNNRCAPSCGGRGHKRKVRGHIKKISAGASRRHCAPHLQIASDAIGHSQVNFASFSIHTSDKMPLSIPRLVNINVYARRYIVHHPLSADAIVLSSHPTSDLRSARLSAHVCLLK